MFIEELQVQSRRLQNTQIILRERVCLTTLGGVRGAPGHALSCRLKCNPYNLSQRRPRLTSPPESPIPRVRGPPALCSGISLAANGETKHALVTISCQT